ncbi:MAG: hypothetical protein SVU32_06570 [Candidatus Nanohaloarchaea archaeon]|nr:hypothetical protein [Candidatus Nanohaloarchaea archaeon]
MKPQAKILVGSLMIVAGIYWYSLNPFAITGMTNLQALVLLFQAGLGVLVFLLGLFIVWIESDELRIQRELEKHDFEPSDYKEQEESLEAAGEEEDKEEVAVETEPDYEEVVDGTVDEVKERVRERDLDPSKVLDAEKGNKDRKTLKEWLESRVDDE